MSELVRMRNTIIPPSKDDDDRKKHDHNLKTLCDSKVKKWPDSVDMAKMTKLDTRKKIFFEKEMDKRRIDEEERKFQEREKKLIIDKASKKMFENQDPVKHYSLSYLCAMF
jgi:hypothetical protein